MDSATQSAKLTFKSIPEDTKKAIQLLKDQEWIATDNFYLAGGTALALQYGHRVSYDLDFFTKNKDINAEKISSYLSRLGNWTITSRDHGTLYGEFNKVKCSFIAYPDFVPTQHSFAINNIKLIDASDIAVMKIMAISQRGKKRDFFDLFWYLKHGDSLDNVLMNVGKKYPNKKHNLHHFLKSLLYFEDAEGDADPQIFFEASWVEVKRYFLNLIPSVAKNVMSLE